MSELHEKRIRSERLGNLSGQALVHAAASPTMSRVKGNRLEYVCKMYVTLVNTGDNSYQPLNSLSQVV